LTLGIFLEAENTVYTFPISTKFPLKGNKNTMAQQSEKVVSTGSSVGGSVSGWAAQTA
jgi:hypothetical protein